MNFFPDKIEYLGISGNPSNPKRPFKELSFEFTRVLPKVLQNFEISDMSLSRRDLLHVFSAGRHCEVASFYNCILDTQIDSNDEKDTKKNSFKFSPTIKYKIEVIELAK